MKLLLADNQPLFRKGLAITVDSVFPNSNIRQSDSWTAVHQSLQQCQFDLVLLNVFMPRQHPWEQELTMLLMQHPTTTVCVISDTVEKTHLNTAFKAGVKGYICKTANMSEIKQALLQVKQGKIYFPAYLWETTAEAKDHVHKDASPLTPRQQTILKRVASGESNKVIARKLDLAESTIKRHIYNICQTLNTHNRVEAVAIAQQQGLLPQAV